eukprot:m.46919 g.46919  ORF g.46919 m.46919 type:complete len:775 (+) comp10428_c0_seq1:514-2838(+)
MVNMDEIKSSDSSSDGDVKRTTPAPLSTSTLRDGHMAGTPPEIDSELEAYSQFQPLHSPLYPPEDVGDSVPSSPTTIGTKLESPPAHPVSNSPAAAISPQTVPSPSPPQARVAFEVDTSTSEKETPENRPIGDDPVSILSSVTRLPQIGPTEHKRKTKLTLSEKRKRNASNPDIDAQTAPFNVTHGRESRSSSYIDPKDIRIALQRAMKDGQVGESNTIDGLGDNLAIDLAEKRSPSNAAPAVANEGGPSQATPITLQTNVTAGGGRLLARRARSTPTMIPIALLRATARDDQTTVGTNRDVPVARVPASEYKPRRSFSRTNKRAPNAPVYSPVDGTNAVTSTTSPPHQPTLTPTPPPPSAPAHVPPAAIVSAVVAAHPPVPEPVSPSRPRAARASRPEHALYDSMRMAAQGTNEASAIQPPTAMESRTERVAKSAAVHNVRRPSAAHYRRRQSAGGRVPPSMSPENPTESVKKGLNSARRPSAAHYRRRGRHGDDEINMPDEEPDQGTPISPPPAATVSSTGNTAQTSASKDSGKASRALGLRAEDTERMQRPQSAHHRRRTPRSAMINTVANIPGSVVASSLQIPPASTTIKASPQHTRHEDSYGFSHLEPKLNMSSSLGAESQNHWRRNLTEGDLTLLEERIRLMSSQAANPKPVRQLDSTDDDLFSDDSSEVDDNSEDDMDIVDIDDDHVSAPVRLNRKSPDKLQETVATQNESTSANSSFDDLSESDLDDCNDKGTDNRSTRPSAAHHRRRLPTVEDIERFKSTSGSIL